MSVVVFLGPTLEESEARRVLDATYLPPVAQGDVLRLLDRPPQAIGIIDGYFEMVPSVWHKEILVAMAQGVRVFGAASMGALRAAELEAFGMEGVGQIFQWYRDGDLEDDDEVAIAHGQAESGYVRLSVAMVDIRDACLRAAGEGVVSSELSDRVIAAAKSMHYTDRSWPAVVAATGDAGWDATELGRLVSFATAGPGLKARDALRLLQHMSDFSKRPWPASMPPVEVERTVFLDRLETEVATMAGQVHADRLPAGDSVLRIGETVATVRKKVLLRLLARREARVVGVTVADADLQGAADAFRREFGLIRLPDFLAWFTEQGLTNAAWLEFLRDRCLLEAFERYYDNEINAGFADYVKIASARLGPGATPPSSSLS